MEGNMEHNLHSGHENQDKEQLSHSTMHMQSTFRLYTKSPMLFREWPTSTMTGLVSAMLATVILAFLYEGLRYYVFVHSAIDRRGKKCPKNATKYQIISRLTGSLLHMLHFTLGYILMLAVMTYNVWIFMALILGATIGYFFVRPTVENHFKMIRSMRDKCGTKQRLLKNNTAQNILLNHNYKWTQYVHGNSGNAFNNNDHGSDLITSHDTACSILSEEKVSFV